MNSKLSFAIAAVLGGASFSAYAADPGPSSTDASSDALQEILSEVQSVRDSVVEAANGTQDQDDLNDAAESVLVPAAGHGIVGAIRWAMGTRR